MLPALLVFVLLSQPAPIDRINAQGTFEDRAGWMYQGSDGKVSMSSPFTGTNELLVLPAPSPPPEQSLLGVEILRHEGDRMGYPVHISLVAKAFARAMKLRSVYLADGPNQLYRFDTDAAPTNEFDVTAGRMLSASAIVQVPAGNAIPSNYQPAFDFAKTSLSSIENLPEPQRRIGNYDLLFVETPDTIWVELGPHYGAAEEPHLGCQTDTGRDMAFGFKKSDIARGRDDSSFLQCA